MNLAFQRRGMRAFLHASVYTRKFDSSQREICFCVTILSFLVLLGHKKRRDGVSYFQLNAPGTFDTRYHTEAMHATLTLLGFQY